jgi:hypothetical protein
MSRMTALAVLVPVLGLAVLVGRAEFARNAGPAWTIPIDGYDPRDLLHGQYLQYQYRLQWAGMDTCGPAAFDTSSDRRELAAECCLCLTHDALDGYDPFVRQIACDEPEPDCDGRLQSAAMLPPRRHFIPEDHALALEKSLRVYQAAIELTVGPGDKPAVHDLVLDRRPWRDVLLR